MIYQFFQGVPGGGKFSNNDDLVQTLTSIIFISTAEHAAVNLPLYDECAFIPNYPSCLRGHPPISKVRRYYSMFVPIMQNLGFSRSPLTVLLAEVHVFWWNTLAGSLIKCHQSLLI